MKISGILATIIGILLVLPLVGIDDLGTVADGILAWIIALVVLVIGIRQIIVGNKK